MLCKLGLPCIDGLYCSLTLGIAKTQSSWLGGSRFHCDLEPEVCFSFQLSLELFSTDAINK